MFSSETKSDGKVLVKMPFRGFLPISALLQDEVHPRSAVAVRQLNVTRDVFPSLYAARMRMAKTEIVPVHFRGLSSVLGRDGEAPDTVEFRCVSTVSIGACFIRTNTCPQRYPDGAVEFAATFFGHLEPLLLQIGGEFSTPKIPVAYGATALGVNVDFEDVAPIAAYRRTSGRHLDIRHPRSWQQVAELRM